MFLLATNVVSEISKRQPHEAVRTWFDSTDEDSLFLSVLVLGRSSGGSACYRTGIPIVRRC